MKIVEIPQEFKKLFDTDWREAAIWGGRYSLKSHTVARVLLIRTRQKKIRVACFREFQNSIAESSYQLLADLIKLYELKEFELTNNSIINKINGSDFIFKGLWNNEQSIKSIEGIDIAWVEEAQAVSETSLEVLTPTVRKDGSQIIYTYNRLVEEDPVHKRLVLEGRPNTLKINVNYDIAVKYGWMPQVIRDEIEDDKKNRPALYKHKWLGEPYNLERKIYRDWNIIDEIPHEARLERYGIDFGYTNDPTAIIAVYYYNGGYILDEITYEKGLLNKPIADILKNLPKALCVADSAEPKSIDEIKQYGINIIGAKKKVERFGNNDSYLKWSIGIVQEQKISLTKRSVNLIKEYRNYLWQVDKNGRILNEPEKGQDHCLVGNTKILMANGRQKKLRNIKAGEWVKTRNGNNEVLLSRLTRKNAEIYEIKLSNGAKLKGTGDHKIYTKRGKIAIDALRDDDIIEVLETKQISLWKKQLSSMVKDIIGMANTILHPVVIKMEVNGCIKPSGNFITDKFPKDTTFITKTETERIMNSLILNLSQLKNIYQNTIKRTGKNQNLEKELKKILTTLGRLQKNGTHLLKELSGIGNTERIVGKTNRNLQRYAASVVKNIRPEVMEKAFFATRIVERKLCEREDVYNLTVNQEHNYYANGILVKNCLDAARYALTTLISVIIRQEILDNRPIIQRQQKLNPAR